MQQMTLGHIICFCNGQRHLQRAICMRERADCQSFSCRHINELACITMLRDDYAALKTSKWRCLLHAYL